MSRFIEQYDVYGQKIEQTYIILDKNGKFFKTTTKPMLYESSNRYKVYTVDEVANDPILMENAFTDTIGKITAPLKSAWEKAKVIFDKFSTEFTALQNDIQAKGINVGDLLFAISPIPFGKWQDNAKAKFKSVIDGQAFKALVGKVDKEVAQEQAKKESLLRGVVIKEQEYTKDSPAVIEIINRFKSGGSLNGEDRKILKLANIDDSKQNLEKIATELSTETTAEAVSEAKVAGLNKEEYIQQIINNKKEDASLYNKTLSASEIENIKQTAAVDFDSKILHDKNVANGASGIGLHDSNTATAQAKITQDTLTPNVAKPIDQSTIEMAKQEGTLRDTLLSREDQIQQDRDYINALRAGDIEPNTPRNMDGSWVNSNGELQGSYKNYSTFQAGDIPDNLNDIEVPATSPIEIDPTAISSTPDLDPNQFKELVNNSGGNIKVDGQKLLDMKDQFAPNTGSPFNMDFFKGMVSPDWQEQINAVGEGAKEVVKGFDIIETLQSVKELFMPVLSSIGVLLGALGIAIGSVSFGLVIGILAVLVTILFVSFKAKGKADAKKASEFGFPMSFAKDGITYTLINYDMDSGNVTYKDTTDNKNKAYSVGDFEKIYGKQVKGKKPIPAPTSGKDIEQVSQQVATTVKNLKPVAAKVQAVTKNATAQAKPTETPQATSVEQPKPANAQQTQTAQGQANTQPTGTPANAQQATTAQAKPAETPKQEPTPVVDNKTGTPQSTKPNFDKFMATWQKMQSKDQEDEFLNAIIKKLTAENVLSDEADTLKLFNTLINGVLKKKFGSYEAVFGHINEIIPSNMVATPEETVNIDRNEAKQDAQVLTAPTPEQIPAEKPSEAPTPASIPVPDINNPETILPNKTYLIDYTDAYGTEHETQTKTGEAILNWLKDPENKVKVTQIVLSEKKKRKQPIIKEKKDTSEILQTKYMKEIKKAFNQKRWSIS